MDNPTAEGSKYFVLSEIQVKQLVQMAGEAGGAAALKKYEEVQKAEKKNIVDKRLHNINMLLKNYHTFKESIENSVYSIRQLEQEQSAEEILSLMMGKENEAEILLKSVKESKIKTSIIMKHIDTMLQIYQIYVERSGDEIEKRRYYVLHARYISDPPKKTVDIAEEFMISEKTVHIDLKYAKERLSALIFGIDGMTL